MNANVCANCQHIRHGERVSRSKPFRTVAAGCLTEGCSCEGYVEGASDVRLVKAADRNNRKPLAPFRAKISDEELGFARWQIKMHLRMAQEIRERYGIQE